MDVASENETVRQADVPRAKRGRLFRKYAASFVATVSLALVTNGLLDIWFSYQEQRSLLVRIQQGQADSAATNITQFVKEIESQMAWATLLPWSAKAWDEWRFDAVRMLRQVPAITELTQLDSDGRELFRMSRHAKDVIASELDHSHEAAFVQAMSDKVYYGSVYFLDESEPYMTLALAGTRRDHGVIVGQVNLKFIWDVVSQIKVGNHGLAYVVDSQARLIAHPDISLVLRNTNMSRLPQVQAARAISSEALADQSVDAVDLQNRSVLNVYAAVPFVDWLVFVQLPIDEAYAPLYSSLKRSGGLLLVALMLAFASGILLARRMTVPIRALHDGAERIGSGDLGQRISIKTRDELEALGDQFNSMAARLQELYATLERKVEDRTRQLENANLAKSRFLAAASHDLRQPLQALGMFVAQLNERMRAAERRQIIARIESALAAMNELFNALLDISRLDAGVLKPNITDFPVAKLLKRVETTFAGATSEKGLSFRVVSSDLWVRSDFILLERIVFNLVTNAVRYTNEGGLVVGCRRRGSALHIEVWDTGIGIPADQHQNIFNEFYRLGELDRDRGGGLGLGLAIVERLCRLLDHPIGLSSLVGKGSRFSIAVPCVPANLEATKGPTLTPASFDAIRTKLVVLIDDDALVRDGMGGLLRSWGCRVVTVSTDEGALKSVAECDQAPDLVVSDYHLSGGKTGVEAVERLRQMLGFPIPAFLMTGDTNPALLREVEANGYHLLHKPVEPMELRVLLSHALKVRRARVPTNMTVGQ